MNARYCPCLGVNSGARFAGAIHRRPRQRGIDDEHTLPGRTDEAERAQLTAMLSGGKHAARKIKRAQILLAADAGVGDEEIARSRLGRRLDGVSDQAALRGRQSGPGAERGGASGRRAQAVRQGDGAAGRDRLLQPAGGSQALDAGSAGRRDGPADRARGDCRARRCGGAWPRTTSSRGGATCGAFRRSMASMSRAWKTCSISMPSRPIPKRPVVCFDESPTQLIGEVRAADPRRAGPAGALRLRISPQRHGQSVRVPRRAPVVAAREGHRAADGAGLRLVHARSGRHALPEAELIRVVLDNLSTHTAGALYETFPAPEAHRILRTPGVPLHAQARQLAEHGRDRDRRAARPVPRPPHRRTRAPHLRNRGLGEAAQRLRGAHQI